jgi:hypothetical protein
VSESAEQPKSKFLRTVYMPSYTWITLNNIEQH